jgi:hypothetical protein
VFERAEGDVERIVIAHAGSGSCRGIPRLRVGVAYGFEELFVEAVEDELLRDHAG